jgi:hypothetical protein
MAKSGKTGRWSPTIFAWLFSSILTTFFSHSGKIKPLDSWFVGYQFTCELTNHWQNEGLLGLLLGGTRHAYNFSFNVFWLMWIGWGSESGWVSNRGDYRQPGAGQKMNE